MTKRYFNIHFEFKREEINKIIEQTIAARKPEYICAVDSNSMVCANQNPQHLEALNGAIINTSDSTWIPMLINIIYHTDYQYNNYTGSDIFMKWMKTPHCRHFFLGSSRYVLDGLKINLQKINPEVAEMKFETLPFRTVENFNYQKIADMINEDQPDIIWVSLGAPKQEQFMNRLKPFLNRGVMIGVGAVFKFNSGRPEFRRSPEWMIEMKLEWLYRVFQEPRRMGKRYWHVFVSMPRLIMDELKINKSHATNKHARKQ